MLYIFDLGNVIVDIDFNRVLGTWSDLSRVPLASLKQSFTMGEAFHQHERGEITDEAFAEALCHEMALPLSYEQFSHGWQAVFVALRPEVIDIMQKLREQLSLQALADAVNLTTTPCWKRLKRLEDDGVLLGRVALLDPEKLGLGLTAFVLIKTQHHSSEWYCRFVTEVTGMPEVLGFWRMAGEYDYLMRVQVADMKSYDEFYKRLVNSVPGLSDVTSSFAMEQIKYTTALPIE